MTSKVCSLYHLVSLAREKKQLHTAVPTLPLLVQGYRNYYAEQGYVIFKSKTTVTAFTQQQHPLRGIWCFHLIAKASLLRAKLLCHPALMGRQGLHRRESLHSVQGWPSPEGPGTLTLNTYQPHSSQLRNLQAANTFSEVRVAVYAIFSTSPSQPPLLTVLWNMGSSGIWSYPPVFHLQ